ncbi:hypothetical protein EKK58_08740 [Candidatus Dependentiae bacterium]|nr:MAG: hypothetical protein EKK58_08740 [Candidatus Dependentiae bacterium]
MLEKIQNNWDLILACVVGFNFLMSGLHAGLEKIKDLTTSTDVDNKAYEIIGKIISFIQKVIDLAVANKAHK